MTKELSWQDFNFWNKLNEALKKESKELFDSVLKVSEDVIHPNDSFIIDVIKACTIHLIYASCMESKYFYPNLRSKGLPISAEEISEMILVGDKLKRVKEFNRPREKRNFRPQKLLITERVPTTCIGYANFASSFLLMLRNYVSKYQSLNLRYRYGPVVKFFTITCS